MLLSSVLPADMMMEVGENNVKAAYRDSCALLAQVKRRHDPGNLLPCQPEHQAGVGSRRDQKAQCPWANWVQKKARNSSEANVARAARRWRVACAMRMNMGNSSIVNRGTPKTKV